MDVVSSKNNLLSIDLSQTKTQLELLQDQSRLLQAQLLDTRSEKENVQKQYDWMKTEMDKLINQMTASKAELDTMKSLEKDMEQIQGNLDQLMKENRVLREENEVLKSKATILSDPSHVHGGELEDEFANKIATIVAESNSEIQELKVKLGQCADELRYQMERSAAQSAQIDEWKVKYDSLHAIYVEKIEIIDKLKEQLVENSKQQHGIVDEQHIQKRIDQEVAELTRKLKAENEIEIKTLQQSFQQKHASDQEAAKRLDALLSEKSNLEKSLLDLADKKDASFRDLQASLTTEVEKYRAQVHELKREKDAEIKSLKSNYDIEIEELKLKQIKDTDKVSASHHAEFEKLTQQHRNDLAKNKDAFEQEVIKLKLKMKSEIDGISSKSNESDVIKVELTKLKQDFETKEREYKTQLSEFEALVMEMKKAQDEDALTIKQLIEEKEILSMDLEEMILNSETRDLERGSYCINCESADHRTEECQAAEETY